MLAAGSGTRFGGRKQLAEVGPRGEAIMDILVRRATDAGFGPAVIVVSPGTEALVRAHVDAHLRPGDPPVELVVQRAAPGRSRLLGTADAVLATRLSIDGPFIVVNADDLYPSDAFGRLAAHLRDASFDEHALMAFRVARTLTGERPVSRALVEAGRGSVLRAVREGAVTRAGERLRFESGGAVQVVPDDALISMNMWGFRSSVFDALADAVGEFVASGRDGEVYLPDVVARMIDAGAIVRVLASESACIGLTHPEDVAALREALA